MGGFAVVRADGNHYPHHRTGCATSRVIGLDSGRLDSSGVHDALGHTHADGNRVWLPIVERRVRGVCSVGSIPRLASSGP